MQTPRSHLALTVHHVEMAVCMRYCSFSSATGYCACATATTHRIFEPYLHPREGMLISIQQQKRTASMAAHPLQALEQGLRQVVALRFAGQHRRRQLLWVTHQHRLHSTGTAVSSSIPVCVHQHVVISDRPPAAANA